MTNKEKINSYLEYGSALSSCNTADDVVALINRNADDADLIAAAYAINAADEAGYGFTEDTIEAHLSYISDANYNHAGAVMYALMYAPLTDAEMDDYIEGQIAEMSDEDKDSFVEDPDSWRDGIESNHVIAWRESHDIYCDDWDTLRDKMLARLGGVS